MSSNPALVAHSYMLIGLAINIWLYGIMTTQVYLYYKDYPKDKIWLKALVAALTLADTLNTVFLFVYLYNSLILHYNDPPYLGNPDWIFATDPALTGIIATMVQLFFAWRILVLTGNWISFSVVSSCAVAGLVAAILTAVEVVASTSFEEFRKFKTLVIIWLAAEALGDLTITGILVTYLKTHKTGFPSSDKLVDRIIRLTIQTGFATSVCALLDLLFFLLFPNGLHLVFNFALSKLYANSLMSTLNSRMGWRFSTTVGSVNANVLTPSAGFSLEVTSDAPTLSEERSQLSSMPPMRFNTRPLEIFTSSESHEFRDADYPIIPSRSLGGGGVIKRKISQNGHDSPSINSGEYSGEIHGTKRVSAAETLVGDTRV